MVGRKQHLDWLWQSFESGRIEVCSDEVDAADQSVVWRDFIGLARSNKVSWQEIQAFMDLVTTVTKWA